MFTRNDAGPLAVSLPISPASPNKANAKAAASKGRPGVADTKAAMREVTAHPVAVIRCIRGTPLLTLRTLLPSVTKSTAPETATIHCARRASSLAGSSASVEALVLSTPWN